ncbi:hypothetical protein OH710_24595 [Pseudomonas capsici]|uniref:hypothetical protein n=1 Tax=Pseudomonas capsici TaxID=2810614 RepID=UPI000F00FB79|nr:hypothetical protein [Pseudomonas capsici]MCV4275825.1 hypothetical protein [Pseudomonas capsici]
MARRTKPATEYYRVIVTAAFLADEMKVARTGWGLARWFEADQGLPKHSVDEKNWRRFLDGREPHQNRLQKIFVAAPAVRSLFNHPIWVALSPTCTQSDGVRVLKSFGGTCKYNDRFWFEGPSELSALDRLACLLAMLSCEKVPYRHWEIGRRLCVEYVDICNERLWKDHSSDLLLLIRMKLEKTAQTLFGLTELDVSVAFKFWTIVKEDFFRHESIAGARAWSAWREAVYNLNWEDQFRLRDYIEHRNAQVPGEIEALDRRVYRRVRARMYRALNKAQATTPAL